MHEHRTLTPTGVSTGDKLWCSTCHQVMTINYTELTEAQYRCAAPCGQHTADADQVRAGLLWHYRGRNVTHTWGLSDEEIMNDMLAALHLAWVRDGRIYTARFY